MKRVVTCDVAVISFALWQRCFGGEPSVLGRTLQVQDAAYRVVGVLPAGADSIRK